MVRAAGPAVAQPLSKTKTKSEEIVRMVRPYYSCGFQRPNFCFGSNADPSHVGKPVHLRSGHGETDVASYAYAVPFRNSRGSSRAEIRVCAFRSRLLQRHDLLGQQGEAGSAHPHHVEVKLPHR